MMAGPYIGLFVAEGTSDMPIADIVESLFFDRGVEVQLRKPDFSLLSSRVAKDVKSRLRAGQQMAGRFDFVVVHRDADNAGPDARRTEIVEATTALEPPPLCLPVIPIRMTEAWLLLDEAAIRLVAGNPRGRTDLGLPKPGEVESRADPKQLLAAALLKAADVTGRQRERHARRFSQHRRQLLERLDPHGRVGSLVSWKKLIADIEKTSEQLRRGS